MAIKKLSPDGALKLFEEQGLSKLKERVEVLSGIKNLIHLGELNTLEELENQVESFITYQEQNRDYLLSTGIALEGDFRWDKWSVIFWNLTDIYCVRDGGECIPHGFFIDGDGHIKLWVYVRDESGKINKSKILFEEAPLLNWFSQKDADRLSNGRRQIYDLRLNILNIILESINKGDYTNLWSKCLDLFKRSLIFEDTEFYFKMDKLYRGSYFQSHQATLSNMISAIEEFEFEIKHRICDRLRGVLGEFITEIENYSDLPVGDYFDVVKHPKKEILEKAIDLMIESKQEKSRHQEEFKQRTMKDIETYLSVKVQFQEDVPKLYEEIYRHELTRHSKALKNKLEKLDLSEDDSFRHSVDFRSVYWRGEVFSFTTQQAQVIEMLYQAYINKTPEVSHKYILEEIGTPSSKLKDTFRKHPGFHPAWNSLIIQGKTKGTVRLDI